MPMVIMRFSVTNISARNTLLPSRSSIKTIIALDIKPNRGIILK